MNHWILILWVVCAIPAFSIAGSIAYRHGPPHREPEDLIFACFIGTILGLLGVAGGPFTILAWVLCRFVPRPGCGFLRSVTDKIFWARWTRSDEVDSQ